MPRSSADLLALKAELTNDPSTLGLTTLPADDAANATKLNLVRETISIKKRSLPTATIFNAIDPLEHQALSSQQSRWLEALLSLNNIDPFLAGNTISGLNDLFSAESNSRPAIEATLTQTGNRIDKLFQDGLLVVGGTVTASDIAQARVAT